MVVNHEGVNHRVMVVNHENDFMKMTSGRLPTHILWRSGQLLAGYRWRKLNLPSRSWIGVLDKRCYGTKSSPGSDDTDKQEKHRDAEKEPLPEWPGGVNPHTGEKGGPKGPEPTRYGDWERKGRVTDF